MSFSAHADGNNIYNIINVTNIYIIIAQYKQAKGILELIKHCEPKAVMLVHGEKSRMEVLS